MMLFAIEPLIIMGVAFLWAKSSNLDIGLRAPALRDAWIWIALFIAYCVAGWVVALTYPTEIDEGWLNEVLRLSLSEDIVISVILGPIAEELLFRGVLFSAIMRRWGIWAAIILPSILWSLTHFQYEPMVIVAFCGAGILLAVIRWKSGSLYVPLALHAAYNLAVVLDARLF